jgi:hypothetical protein
VLEDSILINIFIEHFLKIFPRCAAPSHSAAHLVLRFAPGRPSRQDPFGDDRLDLLEKLNLNYGDSYI